MWPLVFNWIHILSPWPLLSSPYCWKFHSILSSITCHLHFIQIRFNCTGRNKTLKRTQSVLENKHTLCSPQAQTPSVDTIQDALCSYFAHLIKLRLLRRNIQTPQAPFPCCRWNTGPCRYLGMKQANVTSLTTIYTLRPSVFRNHFYLILPLGHLKSEKLLWCRFYFYNIAASVLLQC